MPLPLYTRTVSIFLLTLASLVDVGRLRGVGELVDHLGDLARAWR